MPKIRDQIIKSFQKLFDVTFVGLLSISSIHKNDLMCTALKTHIVKNTLLTLAKDWVPTEVPSPLAPRHDDLHLSPQPPTMAPAYLVIVPSISEMMILSFQFHR